MTSPSDRLRVLLGLCEKATPGPWQAWSWPGDEATEWRVISGDDAVAWEIRPPDAALIAAADPSAVAALCEVAQAAEAVQAARDLEQPKHFAEFVAVLDVERAALARLAECLPEGDQQ